MKSIRALVLATLVTALPLASAVRQADHPSDGEAARWSASADSGLRFYPDDPVPVDPDDLDVPAPEEFELSEYYAFEPRRLTIREGATFTDRTGTTRRVREGDLEHWLDEAARDEDGELRAMTSRWIPGRPLGEFLFHGTRPDDPNDIFPHEHRRELRGRRVFSAWLHHDDVRALNTFDSTWTPPFWAALIVSRFTDEEIRAILTTGKLTDPRAQTTLEDSLMRAFPRRTGDPRRVPDAPHATARRGR